MLAPRPGVEPGTPRSKRGMMVHFTIGASSGRQGSRTLISVGRTALAERPGQPYPAALPTEVDPAGVEPALPARQAGVVPLDHRPIAVRGVGIEPTLSGSQGRRITAFLPPVSSGPPGNRTPISALRRRRLPVGRAAQERSGRGSNPVFRAYQGGVRPQHFQTFELRSPDSNRRGNGL